MDSCPNCGYCKHCGRSDRPAYVPAPYPVFPMVPYWPWTGGGRWWGDGADRIEITYGTGTAGAPFRFGDTTSGM